jgi:ATP-grasp domain-containing protein
MVAHEGCNLILGSSTDPQFGPVLLFGAGGVFVEVFKDRALGLPPLNTMLAGRMMEQTRIFSRRNPRRCSRANRPTHSRRSTSANAVPSSSPVAAWERLDRCA